MLQLLSCFPKRSISSAADSGVKHPRLHKHCGPGKLLVVNACQPIENALRLAEGKVYWVAQRNSNSSDNNAGTQQRPWKTIKRATKELQPGDAVIVREGVYREAIRPPRGGTDAEHRITYAAYPGEKVIVSGADVLREGWTRDGNAWRHAWTVNLKAYGKGVFRREMLIVDSKVLRPVFSRTKLVPGTFFVEGSDSAPVAIYTRLTEDKLPKEQTVEVAKRHPLFSPEGKCGHPDTAGWFRVIGFTFQYAANRAQWGAVCPGSQGSLIEENTIEWTNGKGIDATGRNHEFWANQTNDNGQVGIGGSCIGCLLEYNQSLRNNWKGYNVWWEGGGGKFNNTSNTTIRFHEAGDNNGPGIWLDGNNHDNVIEQSLVYRNKGAGIMLELNTTKTNVSNNVLYGNRWHKWSGAGILSQAASHNIIVHNTFIANDGNGLWIRLDPERRGLEGSNQIFNNLFMLNGRLKKWDHEAEISIAGSDLENARSNQLDGNLYWNPDNKNMFYFNPIPYKSSWCCLYTSELKQWRAAVRGDAKARIANPIILDISRIDGWHLTSRSPAIGMGVKPPLKVLTDIDGQVRPSNNADVGADQH